MPSLLLTQSRFLHVPKTGGNWVARVLGEQFPEAQRMERIHTTRASAPRAELFTFAFVRHPLSWYPSYFSYKQRKGWDAANDWDAVVSSDSFPEFLQAALSRTPAHYSKLLRRFVGRIGEEIEFIGRFESLVDDLIVALQRAGEEFDEARIRMTPPVNSSDYDKHPAVYPAELEQRVLEVESEAVQRFYSAETISSA